MQYTRRQFIVTTAIAGSFTLLPNPLIAAGSPKVTIDTYISEIPNDPSSSSLGKPNEDLVAKATEKVSDFYKKQADINVVFTIHRGDVEHHLRRTEGYRTDDSLKAIKSIDEGIESLWSIDGSQRIPPDLVPKLTKSLRNLQGSLYPADKPVPQKDRITMFHLSFSDLQGYYESNPKQYFADTRGLGYVAQAESVINKSYKTSSGLPFSETMLRQRWTDEFKKEWQKQVEIENLGGMASQYTHRLFTMPLPKKLAELAQTDDEKTNASAFIIAHEIGHTLGLGDQFGGYYGRNNLMDLSSLGGTPQDQLKAIIEFNTRLDPKQVRKMHRFLA